MSVQKSPYEIDINNQVSALEDQIAWSLPEALAAIDLHSFERIVLSGMGSSHYATIPVERELLARGLPVWRVDTVKLLDCPELVTSNTLLWLTSQSGMSGGIVAILDKLQGERRPATLIGVTNDENSTLAHASDILIALKSGYEATVSSKSYLNTLVAQYRTLFALTGQDESATIDAIRQFLPQITATIADDSFVHPLTEALFNHPNPRMALVGVGADESTAMTGALILKEASKMTAEGYLGGEFRHGPMETSGEGMLVVLIGEPGSVTLEQLSTELASNGSQVVTIGPEGYGQGLWLPTVKDHTLLRLLGSMIYIQHMTVAFAKVKQLEPGKFFYGQKVTVKI